MWMGIIQSVENPNRTKRQLESEFPLFLSEDFHISCLQTSELLVLRLLGLRLNYTASFPLLADGRLWDFLPSTTMWANSYNKYPLIYINIDLPICLSICSVSLENPNTISELILAIIFTIMVANSYELLLCSGLCVVFFGLYVCLYVSAHCFDYCSFVVSFEIRKCSLSFFF